MPSAERLSFFSAVVMTPTPRGLVSTSTSPTRAPPLRIRRSGWQTPFTASPKSGSEFFTVWPPTTGTPQAAAASIIPRSTSASTSRDSRKSGKPAMERADTGRAPMA